MDSFRVLLVDSNPENVMVARINNLEAITANILSEDIINELNLQGIGKLFAVTANDEVNALAALHFEDIFGRSEVYQLPYKKNELAENQSISRHLRGRRLFGKDMTFEKITDLLKSPAEIKFLEFNTDEDLQFVSIERMIPLILIDMQNNLTIYTDEQNPKPAVGMRLIYQYT